MADGTNELYLSAASCWEIAIKARLDKIALPGRPDVFIADQLRLNDVKGLPVQSSHALHVFNLPALHRDPFDRIIVAQAQLENLPIVTSDAQIARYKVKVLWS